MSNTAWPPAKLLRYADLWRVIKGNLHRFGVERHTGDFALKLAEHLAWRLGRSGLDPDAEEAVVAAFRLLLDDAARSTQPLLLQNLQFYVGSLLCLSEAARAWLHAVIANLLAEMLLVGLSNRIYSGADPPQICLPASPGEPDRALAAFVHGVRVPLAAATAPLEALALAAWSEKCRLGDQLAIAQARIAELERQLHQSEHRRQALDHEHQAVLHSTSRQATCAAWAPRLRGWRGSSALPRPPWS
jgi:hypothetical protein